MNLRARAPISWCSYSILLVDLGSSCLPSVRWDAAARPYAQRSQSSLGIIVIPADILSKQVSYEVDDQAGDELRFQWSLALTSGVEPEELAQWTKTLPEGEIGHCVRDWD